ncbi:flagellar biosynthesis regulator FlaF [Paracoccus thiocyanatus]|uniref:flagellar biosynthesis regulator FlaF n=1 Tax=Paracoccus thiocyanatus TaxID=34006 RepID=UPI00165F13A7|nr:flagellar biosynthesis regulator FlaF [Paracoccus thiocyanatus]
MSFIQAQYNVGNFGSEHVRTAKDSEYRAFSHITQKLTNAGKSGDTRAMIEAAAANNELWTTLAADLAHPGNKLPPEVKAGLLSLAFFSIKQGRRILQGSSSPDALIDINVKIMKGLRGEGSS